MLKYINGLIKKLFSTNLIDRVFWEGVFFGVGALIAIQSIALSLRVWYFIPMGAMYVFNCVWQWNEYQKMRLEFAAVIIYLAKGGKSNADISSSGTEDGEEEIPKS